MTGQINQPKRQTSSRKYLAKVACLAALPLLPLAPIAATAQNLFAPAVQVNDSVVTHYELDQRQKLLAVLGGAVSREDALQALIEDRIKSSTASQVGAPSDEDVAQAMEAFAARGSLKPEQLISLLGRNGVSSQTFRDFITVGLAWRDYARARFSNRVSISEADIDRALRETGPSAGLLVAMSEIFLPARTPEERAASERLAQDISSRPSIAAFAAAAREHSVAPSRDRSGRMDSALIGNLPGPLRAAARTLKPGEVSEPLSTENAIGIFQLRNLSEVDTPSPVPSSIEYAAYYIDGGRSEVALKTAQKVEANANSCKDLYGAAQGQPEQVLDIDTLPLSQIPTDVAKELAQLDPGEISTALTRADGQTLVVLMLCTRHFDDTEAADRDSVRNRLQTQEITRMAENHLAELRADAYVLRK